MVEASVAAIISKPLIMPISPRQNILYEFRGRPAAGAAQGLIWELCLFADLDLGVRIIAVTDLRLQNHIWR
jgi:hypothetical protein